MPLFTVVPFRKCLLAFAASLCAVAVASPAQQAKPHTFTVSGQQFLMDGKPYQILAGDMHYTRIPRAYWRDRLHKARAMGLNTITAYVFWNVHEPRPGIFDFSGQNDLAEYLHEAQQEGLNVILRPGPYVCAEWELGGYPAWLLKDRALMLRSTEPHYKAAVDRWFARLSQVVRPFLLKNGGPIIAVQLENEYGSFGNDSAYLEQLRQQLIANGMGDGLLYTSNPPPAIKNGSLPGLLTVANFGSGNADKSLARLIAFRPDEPHMVGEYWAGWFDAWGGHHFASDTQMEVAEYRSMIAKGYSVSIYMFDGGTTFGWMNGANADAKGYRPDTTSYDYNAPIDESGNPREKYFGFRKAIMDVTGSHLPDVPPAIERRTYPVAPLRRSASLWDNLPPSKTSDKPLTFEDLDQDYGYVLYRTQLAPGEGGQLSITGLHDYAEVYINQRHIGTLQRHPEAATLDIPSAATPSTLDILVENTGRVNHGKAISGERAGITGTVTLNGKEPASWQMYSLPMTDLSTLHFTNGPCTGPCFFQTEMTVDHSADTYLDTRGLHKGELFLGSLPLGRFWSIGPQFSLYTPGPWLRKGKNAITIFDLNAADGETLTTAKDPVFGATTHERE